MSVYNKFIEGLEHKNRINRILNEDINDKLLSNKIRKKSLNSLLSTRPQLKEDINKIKLKYGLSDEILEQQHLHHQISTLKNKYIKNNTNKYKINNVNLFSYTNKNKDIKINHPNNRQINIKDKNISIPLQYRPTNIGNFDKEKMNFSLSSEQLMNNNSNINFNQNLNDTEIFDKKRDNIDNMNYYKYLKKKRNEYDEIDQKIKEILEDEYISPEKKNKFNNINPISKRIKMLTDIKKEINIINKNSKENYPNNTNNSFLSQFSHGSYTTVGFNYIKPRIQRKSLYEENFSKNNDSQNFYSYNESSKTKELEKPVLIKNLSKQKLNLRHFPSFLELRGNEKYILKNK